MRVYLVQHAQARAKEEDPERGLSQEGVAQAGRMSRWAAARMLSVSSIVHSGKTRARQTAEILAEGLGTESTGPVEGLAPLDPPQQASAWIGSQTGEVMLVGHLPHLERLAALLLSGDPERSPVRFHNAGIVCLEREREQWSLVWSVIPQLVGEEGS